MKSLALAAALVPLAALLAAAPLAAADPDAPSVVVPYGDLDLSTEAGKAALEERIDARVITLPDPSEGMMDSR